MVHVFWGHFVGGGDKVALPWYRKSGTWYNFLQRRWNLVPKIGVGVLSLYESVPTKNLTLGVFGIPGISS